MQQRDNVFQLSLTEIAFIVICLLLFLLGSMLIKRDEKIRNQQTVLEVLEPYVADGGDLSEFITSLGKSAEIQNENLELKGKLSDLDEQIETLEKLKTIVAETEPKRKDSQTALSAQQVSTKGAASKPKHEESTETELISNDELLAQVEALKNTYNQNKQLRDEMVSLTGLSESEAVNQIRETMRTLMKGGADVKSILKENQDLKGSVAFMKKQMVGFGFPPCWATSNGTIEFLVEVKLYDNHILISPKWPASREEDAKLLPNINMATIGKISYEEFAVFGGAILKQSKAQDPECRHYVVIDNQIDSAIAAQRRRLAVENFFYKLERTR